ncbi:LOW QUALITY PROTEIN: uncharacterized protein C20orf96 homolog [Pterocles gutturalis]
MAGGHGGHSKWQKTERRSPARRVTLPPLPGEDGRRKGERNRPAGFMLRKKPPLPPGTSSSPEKPRSSPGKSAPKQDELARTLEEIEVTVNLSNLKKTAIKELKRRSARLAEANSQLARAIRHTDQSTARQARLLLQQYEGFQRVQAMVQMVHRNRLDTARAELQEMEKTMERNLGKLQQQLAELTAKVEALQDELSILRTYIDGQFPAQAVQTVLLQHRIQSLKQQQQVRGPLLPAALQGGGEGREEGTQPLSRLSRLTLLCTASCPSQEEIHRTEKMVEALLGELEEKVWAEKEALLQKVVEEMLLDQDGLKEMVINNHLLRGAILRERQIIKDLEEEIGELRRSIQALQQSAKDPREVIFADVLLRRPRCTPDTEVLLSIPAEETRPLGRSAGLHSLSPHPAPSSNVAPSCDTITTSPSQPPAAASGTLCRGSRVQ